MVELHPRLGRQRSAHPDDPQLASLRHLVRGEDHRGVLAGLGHLPPEGRLALGGILDRRIVGHGGHQPGHLEPETVLEVGATDARVLDHVVEHTRRHHVVLVAGVVQQAGHLLRMHHEGGVVHLAPLTGVVFFGEAECRQGARHRPLEATPFSTLPVRLPDVHSIPHSPRL